MKQQKKQWEEKFCNILYQLKTEMQEMIAFSDTLELAAEWELEDDFENSYYDTRVTVHNDLTATVKQSKKHGGLVMDHPPDPNLPYNPFNSFNEVCETKKWDLSRYEVCNCLYSIIIPAFECHLEKIKKGISAIRQLKVNDITVIESIGMLQRICNQVESLYSEHIDRIENNRPVLPYEFVGDFRAYILNDIDDGVTRRLDEFKIRLGLENFKPAKKGRPENNDAKELENKIRNHIEQTQDWAKRKDYWKQLAISIEFTTEAKEPGKALKFHLTRYHWLLFCEICSRHR